MKPFPGILLLVLSVLLLYIIPAAGRFERGDRYWNGKPQPIGIDFSFNSAIAVYADGADDFAILGIGQPNSGNKYAQYLFTLYNERSIWDGTSAIINDDDQYILNDLDESWYHYISSHIETYLGYLLEDSWLCYRFKPTVQKSYSLVKLCFPDELWQFDQADVPVKPRSRFHRLLSERRIRRLRAMMPKWFRSPQVDLLTRSGFVLSVFELLEDIRLQSLASNITIKSAAISKPDWVFNEMSDLIEEACLLADIEVWEQPRDQFDAAAKTAPEGGSILVLNHGYYHLDVAYGVWSARDQAYHRNSSIGMQDSGIMWLSTQLTYRVLIAYNINANISQEDWSWPVAAGISNISSEIFKARYQDELTLDWPESVDTVNRNTSVKLNDASGQLRIVNLTSQDVAYVESHYINRTSDTIQALLTRTDVLYEHWEGSVVPKIL